MLRKLVTLALVPLVLLAFVHYGTMRIVEYSWNQVVNYQSIYTGPLPAGRTGPPVGPPYAARSDRPCPFRPVPSRHASGLTG